MAERSRDLWSVATVLMFLSFGKGTYGQCTLRNTVVYEGAENTLFSCSSGPNSTVWTVRPTTNAVTPYQINNYSPIVSPTLKGLYAFNETGLIILNATTNTTGGGPISTAGAYIVQFANSNSRTAAKLVVIRSGPTCSCNQSASSDVQISCTIIYADHPVSPINAVMNWAVNGAFYTSTTPTRTLITPYLWNSTSTITVDNTVPATYDCITGFAGPLIANPPYQAMNAPDFSATCTVCGRQTTTIPPTSTSQPPTTTSNSPSTSNKLSTTTPPTTAATYPPSTSIESSNSYSSTTTTQPLMTVTTTTSAELTTVSPQPESTQQMTTHDEILLCVKLTLSIFLGCLSLMTVVCWCWCCGFYPAFCGRQPKQQTRYMYTRPIVNTSEPCADDFGFWRHRHILRYTGRSYRHARLSYQIP